MSTSALMCDWSENFEFTITGKSREAQILPKQYDV